MAQSVYVTHHSMRTIKLVDNFEGNEAKCISFHEADYECEYCGYIRNGYGYEDSNFHNNVIPDMVCPKCDKKAEPHVDTVELAKEVDATAIEYAKPQAWYFTYSYNLWYP